MERIDRGIEEYFHHLDPKVIEVLELKFLRYKGPFKDGSADGVVVYKIFENEKTIVYSNVTSNGLSSINGAEKIIKGLKEEVKNLQGYRFFDMQTYMGYPAYGLHEGDITEITIDEDGTAHFSHAEFSDMPAGFFTNLLE